MFLCFKIHKIQLRKSNIHDAVHFTMIYYCLQLFQLWTWLNSENLPPPMLLWSLISFRRNGNNSGQSSGQSYCAIDTTAMPTAVRIFPWESSNEGSRSWRITPWQFLWFRKRSSNDIWKLMPIIFVNEPIYSLKHLFLMKLKAAVVKDSAKQ